MALWPLSAESDIEQLSYVARDTLPGGVHNCPRCGVLVTWGLTHKGNQARFDFPPLEEGYINHHITCPADPSRERTRDTLEVHDLTYTCESCERAIGRGGVLCADHWAEFQRWRVRQGPDAYTLWKKGEKEDRRVVLLAWLRLREDA